MRAVLAAVLLAISTAPASAGFRYLPPAVDVVAPEAATEEPAPARTDPPAAPVAAPPADPGPEVWRVDAGETLRAVLARWGRGDGTDVLFLTDRRYRLDGAAAFEGGFMDAVQALFRGLSHLPHAPVAARSEGGTTLVVTHRSRRLPDKGVEP